MEEDAPLLDKRTSKSRQESGCYFPCRYALAILSCAGFSVVYLLRVNLSVALVAMVNSTYANAKASAHDPECQRNTSAFEYKNLKLIRCKESIRKKRL